VDFTPYELRHLAAHLVAAKRYSDVHRLLLWPTGEPVKNMWYEACAEAGELAGYLGDIRHGWDAAVASLGAGTVECLALQARYALMTATMGSLASAVPPSLMVELVRTGAWTVEQAVEAARRVPDFEQRVEALMGVSMLSGLPQQDTDRLWQESLEAAEAITDDYLRAGVLARLSVTLPEHLQERVYRVPFPSPEEIDIRYATGATTADSETSEQHSEARMVRDLIEALTTGTPDAVDHALQVALGLTGELQRTIAFAQVVPRLVEQGRRSDAQAAVARLTAADRAARGRQRVRTARTTGGQAREDAARDAPRWQAELLADEVAGSADPTAAARAALAVSTQVADDELVDELVAHGARRLLEAGSVDEAVSEAATLRSQRHLGDVLTLLAATASPAQASAVEAIAGDLDDARERAAVLLTLPATADDATRRRELVSQLLEDTGDPAPRAELAALLASASGEPDRSRLVREAVSCIGDIVDLNARARVMARVLRHTPEAVGHLDVHLQGAHPTHDALALEAFASALARRGQIAEAVAVVSGIVDRPWRDCAAYSVSIRLASDGYVGHAVELAATLSEPFLTAELIRNLAATPSGEMVADVWQLLDAIVEPVRRAMALTEALRAHSSGQNRARSLTALRGCLAASEDPRVVVPLRAAARLGLPVDDLRQCVDSLHAQSVRSVALAGLALHAGDEEPLNALEVLSPAERLSADLVLADCFEGTQLLIVLEDAAGLVSAAAGDRRLRQRLLAMVRPGLGLTEATLTRLWSSSLEGAGRQERPDALETVRSLQGVAVTLGGPALVCAIGSATRQVAQWWP
jgi:hypothetical protein